ncbi:tRNA preQ1(34) S-adenosylmethionine ribosyltransferase-isomerase QueA [Roseospira marina]|uniref:S-adenosylmethionine:tRNA ribosyltransferase-isomerase n=1 Tax=Roseospira marina TaxID=140057 RepID=A0A5M6ICR1_9PROT|nr:tRNA preQ1(34) S-adenosylmethionine ribosyltransferase-isomerase QueA [Roseospira marina]KAA5606051.1 tRNA preQ1(34) S-adenosylmethionine ribosyltransferase-isomerase QueA [Roseospira marina]MBB4313088.1 S-adenosylmethionine:tRNA ribosyltransferase-isomerase [Roseospira marina]MBB5086171.1 S-adenosylmethionine:tRNA ribosyltransferase-isomerase [Roseospira marina]
MRVNLFDFPLPPDRIADRPARPRDAARLLHVGADGALADHGVLDLPDLLDPGDVLVLNDTRVIPARLFAQVGAGKVEIMLHRRSGPDTWWAFARPARKLKPGTPLRIAADFQGECIAKGDGGEVEVRFDRGGATLMAALEAHGHIPLPPYIKRPDDAEDRADYQTVHARADGAVAAPTAGLHMTERLFAALDARGVQRVTVTLHVGAGTFLPVKTDDTDDHRMHVEDGVVTAAAAETIQAARAAGGKVVAVGTTALRVLESAAAPDGTLSAFAGGTDIFITPGYRFRIVDRLLTNFHLPRSTLFMLVSAFSGLETMQAAYAHAIATGYRFYSYGDASLLERRPNEPG